jgi:hypothetical protein
MDAHNFAKQLPRDVSKRSIAAIYPDFRGIFLESLMEYANQIPIITAILTIEIFIGMI